MGHWSISNQLRRFCGRRDARTRLLPVLESLEQFRRNRAKISIEEPGVASCRQLMDNGMASVSQLNPYQCDQCGTANIVAAPVLYQQGTHTYSTRFHSGTTQSFSAQAGRHLASSGLCPALSSLGNTNMLYPLFGASSVLSAFSITPSRLQFGRHCHYSFASRFCVHLGGMLLSFRRIARYNREAYPRLRWNWEHTYICRRCGRSPLIPS